MKTALVALCFAAAALAADKDPAAIIELGAAPGWSLKDGSANVGPTAAVEFTPIEKWLEIEAGFTAIPGRHTSEYDTDLLFKKPWTVTDKLEFMAGIGPEWLHSSKFGVASNAVAAEAALDFMYWPTRSRRIGWYFEPAFEYSFAHGHEKSLGFSAGLLIAIW